MALWKLNPDYQNLAPVFGSLDAVFSLQGERITKDRVSEVIRIEINAIRYYVKRYWDAGKGILLNEEPSLNKVLLLILLMSVNYHLT